MKCFALLVCAALPLVGCASYRGGTSEKEEEYSTQSDLGEVRPAPMASPSFRPGINPEDVRDPHFPTRPQPDQVPSQTSPP